MPLYFFDLVTPDEFSRGEVGIDYPNVEAAYLAAHQAALDMTLELLRGRADPDRHAFEIRDQDGRMLFELPFSEVVHPLKNALPPRNSLHASINHNRHRTERARFELMQSVAQTRALLADTAALLKRT